MPDQHIWVDDGDGGLMIEAQFAAGPRHTFQRWYLCRICGREFPKSKVVLKGDTAYCIPFKHYEEMK